MFTFGATQQILGGVGGLSSTQAEQTFSNETSFYPVLLIRTNIFEPLY